MALQPRHYIIGILGAGVLGGLAWLAFRTEPVPVDLATLQSGPMVVTVNADGKTRVKDVFVVAAPIDAVSPVSARIWLRTIVATSRPSP